MIRNKGAGYMLRSTRIEKKKNEKRQTVDLILRIVLLWGKVWTFLYGCGDFIPNLIELKCLKRNEQNSHSPYHKIGKCKAIYCASITEIPFFFSTLHSKFLFRL